MKQPNSLITGHRGASSVAPENTLSAFQKAWDIGCDAIEGDFRLTCDGEIICIHDANTRRTTGINREVAQTPLKLLQTLDFGAWKDVRFKGDTERAKKVYQGYKALQPEDIAEIIHFVITRPYHVNIEDLVVYPSAQVSATMINKK